MNARLDGRYFQWGLIMLSSLVANTRVFLLVLASFAVCTQRSHAQQLKHVLPHKSRVGYVAFSPDSKIVATLTHEGTAFWEVQKAKLVGGWKGSMINADEFAFTPDGKRLVGIGSQQSVAMRNVATGRAERIVPFTDTIYTMSVSPDGKSVATSTGGKSIRIHEIAKGKEVLKIVSAHTRMVTCVCFGPSGSTLASIG